MKTTACDTTLRQRRTRGGGFAVLAGLTLTAHSLTACRAPERLIFPPHDPPIEWPARPLHPRIRYIGQLHSSADLQARRSLWQRFGDLIVGQKKPDEVYGPRNVLPIPERNLLWVADPGGRCLHLFNFQTRQYKKFLTAGGSSFLSPTGVCRGPTGFIFVCDSERVALVRLSDRTGDAVEELLLPDIIQRPVDIYYDFAEKNSYIVDAAAHDIKVVGLDGVLQRVIGRRGDAAGEFNFPIAITGNDELLWVVDAGNHRVQGLTHEGQPRVAFGQAGDAPGTMALPKGIAVDSYGHVYVVDARFENVQVFDPSGRLLLFFGHEGHGPGEFWLPSGIAIDANDRIWVCDSYNQRVQVFDYLRAVETEHTETTNR